MQTANAPEPSAWVTRFVGAMPSGRQVLDLACGGGRHTRLALALGHPVTALDRTLDGIADLGRRNNVELIAADLESGGPFPLIGRMFAGVIVTNYLWRPILADIVAVVADDGLLVYETFAVGNERYGRPSNPEFLLRPNELVDAVRPRLTIVAYEHGYKADDGRPRIVQRIAACGAGHAWAAHGSAAP